MLRRFFSHTDAGSARAITAGFVLVILSFSASILLSLRAVATIGREADSVVMNVLPSVSTVSDARTALRQLEVGLQVLSDEASSDDLSAFTRAPAAALQTLEDDVADYFRQPVFQGEDESWPAIRREVGALHSGVEDLVQAASAHRAAAARGVFLTEISPVAERLDALLEHVLVFHAEQSTAAATRIARAHHGATTLGVGLGGTSIILSLVLLRLVLHTHSGFAELTARHARLLDTRATELEMFAKRVAHDVMSPLGAVALTLDIASKHHGTERAVEALARGRRGIERAVEVIDGLYEFARASAAPDLSGRADAQQVIPGVLEDVRSAAEAAGVEVRSELAVVGRQVRCPRGVLAVITGNLVRNAIKHMATASARRVMVRLADGGSTIRLEIEDTGPGIPDELGATLFEAYSRGTSSSGLGLGLATVKRLVDAYGGTVTFTSRHGAGTTFRVTLPTATPTGVTDDFEGSA